MNKAWSLVGGLLSLMLTDTLTRPAFAQASGRFERDDQVLFLAETVNEFTGSNKAINSTGGFFELDVEIRPAHKVEGLTEELISEKLLSLFATDDNKMDNSEDPNHAGYLEKNLQDFFDIQIFSTVYFGSRHEPH